MTETESFWGIGWDALCTCGHEMRSHRLDWDSPLDGVEPDCALCGCMEFTLAVET